MGTAVLNKGDEHKLKLSGNSKQTERQKSLALRILKKLVKLVKT